MPVPPLAVESRRARKAVFARLEGKTPSEIAAFWLSEPEPRSLLNEQLAVLLRTILEGRAAQEAQEFSYCPLCGGALSPSERADDDIWARGLQCPEGHYWGERGGHLSCILGGRTFTLHGELTEASVRRIVHGWLENRRHLATNLHHSLRRVLKDSSHGRST